MKIISAIQSVGELSSRISAVGLFTEDVVSALGSKYSSTGASDANAAGLFRNALDGSTAIWLFCRCLGVIKGESGWDEGARVGEDVVD